MTGEVNDTEYLFIVDGIYWVASEDFVHTKGRNSGETATGSLPAKAH